MALVPGPAAGQRRAVATRPDPEAVRPGPPGLPRLVEPARPGTVLLDWALSYPDTVRSWLHGSGALLFRGFGVGLDEFGPLTRALAGEPASYLERSSPRTELADRVYTATDYPADQRIPLHNENSYQRSFPAALAFCCLVEPTDGGATPLADTRAVLRRLPARVVAPFADRGVMYVRNFRAGLGLDWTEVFQTGSRAEVAAYCAGNGIEAQWLPDGGLRTRQVRPAVARHPVTGDRVWFNHGLFFNAYSLPAPVRVALLDQFGIDRLPNHTYYGDGTPIPDEVLDTLAAGYAAEEVAVPWRAGDVLLVDNLLAAHGRQPFEGPRRVVVGMAGPLDWDRVRP